MAFAIFLQRFCNSYLDDKTIVSSSAYDMLESTLMMKKSDVLNSIISKILKLLKQWGHFPMIYNFILGPNGLFNSLGSGYISGQLLGKSDLVTNMVEHHVDVEIGDVTRMRISFYKTLGRLFFGEKTKSNFFNFIGPFSHILDQIKGAVVSGNGNKEQILSSLKKVTTDIRGVVSSINDNESYSKFFDWFYLETSYFDWLIHVLSMPEFVTPDEWIAIMKLIGEIVRNTSSRLNFPHTSANSLRLFRSTANLLIQENSFIHTNLEVEVKFMYIKYYLSVLYNCLSGKYTNFGVFELYNDPILDNLLQSVIQILYNIQPSYLDLYPKVKGLYYQNIEVIASGHISFIIKSSNDIFGRLLHILKTGLKSNDVKIVTDCCGSVEKILEYIIVQVSAMRNSEMDELIQLRLYENKPIFDTFFTDFLDILITYYNIHFSIGKPLLCLIILFENSWYSVKELVTQSQTPEKRNRIGLAFDKLMEGINKDIEKSNVDTFMNKLSDFRAEIVDFVDVNALYTSFLQFSND
eukprot:TRINITY_DN3158_c0_g1_i1.p1 TRINITY_DN3158_c0_g1~~TRINITY_DN3158_c0_g1_i1.p1  ORF type:complete len:537 (-),score=88.47 TRINITY_DN3158_c0_g1_i1:8-1573(-)